jgi:hypothetical protein
MRYRTKLYLSLLGVTFVSVLLALFIVYRETNKEFMREYNSKVLSIAATTAAFLEGDTIKTIVAEEDENRSE